MVWGLYRLGIIEGWGLEGAVGLLKGRYMYDSRNVSFGGPCFCFSEEKAMRKSSSSIISNEAMVQSVCVQSIVSSPPSIKAPSILDNIYNDIADYKTTTRVVYVLHPPIAPQIRHPLPVVPFLVTLSENKAVYRSQTGVVPRQLPISYLPFSKSTTP